MTICTWPLHFVICVHGPSIKLECGLLITIETFWDPPFHFWLKSFQNVHSQHVSAPRNKYRNPFDAQQLERPWANNSIGY